MATQLARRGLCSSFDHAMKWTPRKMFAVLAVDARLRRIDQRQELAIIAMGSRGDPKAVEKVLKDDSP